MPTRNAAASLWFGLALSAGLFILACSPAAARDDKEKPSGEGKTDEAKAYKVKTAKDIAYYEGEDAHKTKHKLDLYYPDGLEKYPVLVFVHGGGWVSGDRNYFLNIYGMLASVYAKQGIGVVVPSYRLSPEVKHPEHVKDVARAIAWTHGNIAKYGGSADKLILCGHSAGAHLVALVTADETYLKDQKLTATIIKGVVPISGPLDLPNGFLTNVFGKEASKASPLEYVREELPPFLILYADKDLVGCDRIPAEKFCKALKEKKVTAETVEIKDSGHIDIIRRAGTADSEVQKAIAKFVKERTK